MPESNPSPSQFHHRTLTSQYYDRYYLTKPEYFVDILPISFAGALRIGKGVKFIDPSDLTLIQQDFLDVTGHNIIEPKTDEFMSISEYKDNDKPQITFDQFRKTASSYYYEYESTEVLAMHLWANFGIKGGFASYGASIDFVKNTRQHGHLIVFNQEVEIADSKEYTITPNKNQLSKIKKIDSYKDDYDKLSYFSDNFGTHYINNIIYGSKLVLCASMRTNDNSTKLKFSAYFRSISAKAEIGADVEKFFSDYLIEIKMKVIGGASSDVKILSSISEIKDYFSRLNSNEYKVSVAPTKCRIQSFRLFLDPMNFPNLSRLLMPSIGEKATSPFGVPSGTIVAWYPPNLDSKIKEKKNVYELIPDGWGLCDGNDGRPNLIRMFVCGTDDINLIGSVDGSETHSHTGKTDLSDGHRNGSKHGGNFEAMGIDHAHSFSTGAASHIPPHLKVAFIIKL